LRWFRAIFDCSAGIIAARLYQSASQPIWLCVTIGHEANIRNTRKCDMLFQQMAGGWLRPPSAEQKSSRLNDAKEASEDIPKSTVLSGLGLVDR
jgi:hypothetical protein